jgi:hypothetical protein
VRRERDEETIFVEKRVRLGRLIGNTKEFDPDE